MYYQVLPCITRYYQQNLQEGCVPSHPAQLPQQEEEYYKILKEKHGR